MKNFGFIAMIVLVATALMSVACSSSKTADTAAADSNVTSVKHPDWSRNAVIYEVNLRQYTDEGTLAAFEKELPRLKELGVDILWYMPIHPISVKNRKGELGSYYAVADYKAFNPEFGTLAEFKEHVKKAHDMGFKVIIDWVPNHSGCDNPWVEEHPDWYCRDEEGNMYGPYDWTDVYKFDYSNPDMRRGMIDALRFWVEEVGVDGFRCDVAGEVPVDFWNEARAELQSINPELFMLAEAAQPELQVDAFDMAYNWPLKDLFNAIAMTYGNYNFKEADGNMREYPERHAANIDSLMAYIDKEYPRDTYMMNMITNHDLNSWEGTEFERYGKFNDAFAVLSYTLPGMPLIYTGQETGLNRALEFFKKDVPPTWEPRNEYFTFYQKLNNLKHTQPALAAGDKGGEMVRYQTTNPNLYAFSRTADGKTVMVIANLSNDDATVEFAAEAPSIEGMTDIFAEADAAMPATLAAGEYRVFATK